MICKQINLYRLIACLVPIWIVSTLSEANSQVKSPPKNKPYPIHNINTKQLTAEPNLPYLPRYSSQNSHFISGQIATVTPMNTSCCTLRYEVMETPQQVLNWYKNALQSAGFKIRHESQTSFTAQRLQDRITIILQIQTANQPGFVRNPRSKYNCSFRLRYLSSQ